MTTTLIKDFSESHSVYASKDILNIKGFKDVTLKVYSTTGSLQVQKYIDSEDVSIQLTKGLYIVDIDGTKYKVIIE